MLPTAPIARLTVDTMAKFINVFALSIFRDRIELPNEYRQRLVDLILQHEAADKSPKPDHSAWLGDTGGGEFLFKHEEFPKDQGIQEVLRVFRI